MEDRTQHKFTGKYELEGHLATCNLNPGVRVYGEKLIEHEDVSTFMILAVQSWQQPF
jgi:fibrillarin-like rRNA methylase